MYCYVDSDMPVLYSVNIKLLKLSSVLWLHYTVAVTFCLFFKNSLFLCDMLQTVKNFKIIMIL